MASTPDFKYAPMFQMGEDTTEYRLLTKEGVSTGEFEGKTILKVSKEALTLLAQQAFHDVEFMLRREHNLQVAKILSERPARMDRLRGRRGSLTRCIQHLHTGQPPLLAERSAQYVRRGEHTLQPPRTD